VQNADIVNASDWLQNVCSQCSEQLHHCQEVTTMFITEPTTSICLINTQEVKMPKTCIWNTISQTLAPSSDSSMNDNLLQPMQHLSSAQFGWHHGSLSELCSLSYKPHILCLSKNHSDVGHYSFEIWQLILVILGRNVAKRVSYHMVVYFSHNCW